MAPPIRTAPRHERVGALGTSLSTSRAGNDHGAHRGGALRGQGHGGLGPGAHRLRRPGLSLRRQGLRGAGARPRRHEAHHRGPTRGDRRSGSTAACRAHHRPHPRRRGARPRGTEDREHHRRSARPTLPARARGGALQAHHRRPVPACHRALHRARPRQPSGLIPGPHPGRRSAARAQRPPGHGQPGDRHPLAHDRPGHRLGRGGGDDQPLPLRPQVPHAPARALPDGRGVSAPRPGAGRDGGARAPLALRGRRASACSCSPAAGATRS